MNYSNFTLYNIVGAMLWCSIFVGGGAVLGNVPAVKENFSIVRLFSTLLTYVTCDQAHPI